MAITFDKLIQNFQRIDKNFGKIFETEILNIFEPIVYQVVLTTRIDSGTGRASVGYEFATKVLKVPSQRILDAIEYDITENVKAYHFWANSFGIKDPLEDYKGIAKKLIKKNKVQVNIACFDQGVINQNNGEKPSDIHPRKNSKRHIPYHFREITAVIDSNIDLENFSGASVWLSSVADDIRIRIKELYEKIEKELFK